jgi:hypothetical protein
MKLVQVAVQRPILWDLLEIGVCAPDFQGFVLVQIIIGNGILCSGESF